MTNIIYVVTCGEYSDYRILGVFSTEENAQLFIDNCNNEYYSPFEIEVYEVNEFIPQLKQGYSSVFVRMDKSGMAFTEKREIPTDDPVSFDSKGNMYATVLAKDENHAIKIMNERRAAIIAAARWGEND